MIQQAVRPVPRRLRPARIAVLAGVGLALLAAATLVLRAAVPNSLVILAGQEGSTYWVTAERYRDRIARDGIEVEIVTTAGGLDSLTRLAAPDTAANTVAFAQAGVENLRPDGPPLDGVVALGSLYVEPFWLFARRGVDIEAEQELGNWLIVPGLEGSSVRAATEFLLRLNGISDDTIAGWLDELPPHQIYPALAEQRADAAFIIGLPGTPLVKQLLEADFLQPVTFPRADAYDRRGEHLHVVDLPEGAVDLARNIPDRDLRLLASTTQLLVREDMSPILVDVLMDAATAVHREATLFTDHGAYPTSAGISLPLDESAERYYRDGPSTLRRLLPYWLATLVHRFALGGAALVTVLAAALNIVPALLRLPFVLTRRRYVRRLVAIERAMAGPADLDDLEEQLAQLTRSARELRVPALVDAEYTEMCQLIFDASERLAAHRERAAGKP